MSAQTIPAQSVGSSAWLGEPRTTAALPTRNGVGGGSGAPQKKSFTFFEIVLARIQIAGILPTCKTNQPSTRSRNQKTAKSLFSSKKAASSSWLTPNWPLTSSGSLSRRANEGRETGRRGAKAPRSGMGDALAQDRAGATGRMEREEGSARNFRTDAAREVSEVAEAGGENVTHRSGAGSPNDPKLSDSGPGARV